MIDRAGRDERSRGWSRRGVLRASVVGTVVVAGVGAASAQETGDGATDEATETATATETTDGETVTYELGGRTEGWEGRSPERISGETNPTLNLSIGTDYEVVWENLDGQPHDFTLRDDEGNDLEGTETMSEEGETRSLSFTASEEMASYVCTVHQDTMSGDLALEGETTDDGNGTTDEDGTAGENGTNGEDEETTEEGEIAAASPGQQEETTVVGPDEGDTPGEETTETGTDQPGFGALATLAALAAVAAGRLLRDGDDP